MRSLPLSVMCVAVLGGCATWDKIVELNFPPPPKKAEAPKSEDASTEEIRRQISLKVVRDCFKRALEDSKIMDVSGEIVDCRKKVRHEGLALKDVPIRNTDIQQILQAGYVSEAQSLLEAARKKKQQGADPEYELGRICDYLLDRIRNATPGTIGATPEEIDCAIPDEEEGHQATNGP